MIMLSEDTKILEFNQYKKSDKPPFFIYADREYLIEKIDGCKNNPENSSTTKLGERIPSGFSMSTMSTFKCIKNKHDLYRGKDCMKNFCESLRENTMEIINFEREKEVINKQTSEIILYQNSKICYICKEKCKNKLIKDKKYCKVKDHCHFAREYRGAACSICNLWYKVPKEIPKVFHNGSNCDYHFIIEKLAEEFEKKNTCLGENYENYIIFLVSVEKRSYKN